MEIEPRPLWVEELLLVDRPDADHAVLEMVCGKGGYVRAVARDLGQALGCSATWPSSDEPGRGRSAEDGLTMDRVEALARTPALDAHLLPLEIGLEDVPELRPPPRVPRRCATAIPAWS